MVARLHVDDRYSLPQQRQDPRTGLRLVLERHSGVRMTTQQWLEDWQSEQRCVVRSVRWACRTVRVGLLGRSRSDLDKVERRR